MINLTAQRANFIFSIFVGHKMEARKKKSRQTTASDVLKDHFRALHPRPGSDHPTFTTEFIEIEELSRVDDFALSCSCAELAENTVKNRYTNVLARTCVERALS